jgi:DNA-binding transcriptional MerR regulator
VNTPRIGLVTTESTERATEPATEQWRVEELARRADLSVDTIRFYQKRRLLPPPARAGRVGWYGPEHLERLARVRDMRSRGLTLALIGRILDGDLDPTDAPLAAAVFRADAETPEEFLTLAELAERSGVPVVLLEAVARENLLVARMHDGDARYTTADIAIVQQGLRLLEQGLPLPDLLALAHAHHETTRDIAETAVGLFDRYVRAPLRASDLTDDEKAERLVEAFRALLPAVTALVAHHFRRVLLEVAQEHLESVGEEIELAAVNVAAGSRLESWPT